MPPSQLIPFAWPKQGLVQNTALMEQPPGTATDCLNVRNYDVYDERNRGGQRTGIAKYFADAIDEGKAVDGLATFVTAFNPDDVLPSTKLYSLDFSDQAGDTALGLIDGWRVFINGGTSNMTEDDDYLITTTSTGRVHLPNDVSSRSGVGVYEGSLGLGESYSVQATITWETPGDFVGIVFRADADAIVADDRERFWEVRFNTNGGVLQWIGDNAIKRSVSSGSPTLAAGTYLCDLRVSGSNASLYVDNTLIDSVVLDTTLDGNVQVGISLDDEFSTDNEGVDLFEVFTAATPASLRAYNIIVACDSDIHVGTPDSGLSIPTGGTSAVVAGRQVAFQSAFTNVFVADGRAASYVYYDSTANEVKDWATDVTAGSLPVGSVDSTVACRIMALYRGRVVMSGLFEEPQNWFMSKAGDPFNWDYSPATTNQTQAVAGNNSNAGELGDVVTALAPYRDDVLVMGGANSLWLMQGDPAAGGQIDNLTRQIGIVGPDAWTWDSGGNLYFFGANGLYRMPVSGGGELIHVSRNKLDQTFSEVDVATNRVALVYDPKWQGVHIFISPVSQPASGSTHYFYDERNDAFWPDQYPANVGPTRVATFFTDDPADTAVLLGGYDGFLRQFSNQSMDDDGSPISSFVRFPPIVPGGTFGSARMDDLYFILDQQSDPVRVDVWKADTVEEAERLADTETKPALSRMLAGRRNGTIRQRLAANSFIVELSQNGLNGSGASWAYESGGGKTAILSRMRGRHVS